MALKLYSKAKPSGEFALIDAVDVEMANGSRLEATIDTLNQNVDIYRNLYEQGIGDHDIRLRKLEEAEIAYPIESEATELQPEVYYVFGEVDGLNLSLVELDDGYAHEYCFEFIPTETFSGLTVTPMPRWSSDPQFPAGKTVQVSILRGIGVMVCA